MSLAWQPPYIEIYKIIQLCNQFDNTRKNTINKTYGAMVDFQYLLYHITTERYTSQRQNQIKFRVDKINSAKHCTSMSKLFIVAHNLTNNVKPGVFALQRERKGISKQMGSRP